MKLKYYAFIFAVLLLVGYVNAWTVTSLLNQGSTYDFNFSSGSPVAYNDYILISTTSYKSTDAYINFSGLDYSASYLNSVNVTIYDANLGSPTYHEIFKYAGTFNQLNNKTLNFKNKLNTLLQGCPASQGGSPCMFVIRFEGDVTGRLRYSDVYISNQGINENAQTYSSTVQEGSNNNYQINITYDGSYYTSATASLYYNNTIYSSSVATSGDDTLFTSNFNAPTISSASENKNFYWNITLTHAGVNTYFISTTKTQTITKVNILSSCSADKPSINFTTKDSESPYPKVNASFKATWNISGLGNTAYQDLSGLNSTFSFCFNGTNAITASAVIEYYANGYEKNFYYLNNANITNTTAPINLYLLNSSDAAITTLFVRNQALQPIANVYFTIQKYDVGLDTYYTVAMAKSGDDGKDIAYLNWYDTIYKIILTKEGSIIKTTIPYKISYTPQVFDITPANLFPYDKFDTLQYTLVYNNLTNNFILTYNDPTGLVSSNCLKVLKVTTVNNTIICDSCQASSSATLYCNIASYGNGTYTGSYYAKGSYSCISSITITTGFSESIYNFLDSFDASFYAFLFAGIVVSMFLITPALGVIGSILGLIGGVALGFQPFDQLSYLALIIVGGIVVWLLKR